MLAALLASIADNTEYLYNSKQTVVTGCYSDDVTLTYNKNIRQITVELEPLNNAACNSFVNGIEASLILRSGNGILSKVISDFSYKDTRQIVFSNVAEITDEKFAVLHLSNYKYITEVDIFVFEEQKSALGECYLPDSNVVIELEKQPDGAYADKISIYLTSTGLCSEQMQYSGGQGLRAVQLDIMGTKVDLVVDEVIAAYASTTLQAIVISGIEQTVLSELKQKAVVYGQLLFTAVYNAKEIVFTHTIGQFTIMGMGFNVPVTSWTPEDQEAYGKFGDAKFWHPGYVVLGLWNNKFVCRAENHPMYDNYLLEKYKEVEITHFTVRLTAILDNEEQSFERTYFETYWSSHKKIFEFACDQGTYQEQQECKKFYEKAVNKRAKYVFEVLFYNDEQFKYVETIVLYEVPSCWKSAIMEKQDGQICVNLITRDNTDVCDSLLPKDKQVAALLTFEFMNLDTDEDFSLFKYYVYDLITIDRNVAEYCIDCSNIKFDLGPGHKYWESNCVENRKELFGNNLIVNVMVDSNDPDYFFEASGLIVVTDRMAKISYRTNSIVVFTICGLILLTCVVCVVVGIIQLSKQMKMQKRRKAP